MGRPMRVLFVHQSFPAQYKHMAAALAADPANQVIGLRQKLGRDVPGVRSIVLEPVPTPAAPRQRFEPGLNAALDNADAVHRAAQALKAEGFTPDIMLGHNGWGEILFLKDVWPNTPLLGFFEFFYRFQGADTNFDPEFPSHPDHAPRTRMMNAVNLLGLDAADWGQSPTNWQARRYPEIHWPRMSVIHDGIDTDLVQPNPRRQLTLPNGGPTLSPSDEVVTYISRNLEPYRGFHTFMRALPEILRRRPKAHVLVIGGDGVSYGAPLSGGETFRAALLRQIGPIDTDRVHFLGQVAYEHFLAVLQISSVHIYLTYPFVLSWSMMEAMSAGCLVVGSSTPPVTEVIRDGDNGLLVDFFNPRRLAERVDEVLSHPDRMAETRLRARRTIVESYDLRRVCLPAHLALINDLIAGRPPKPMGAFRLERALALAAEAAQRGDLAAAESLYGQILAQKPDTPQALEGMALLLYRRGRRAEAVALLDRAHPGSA